VGLHDKHSFETADAALCFGKDRARGYLVLKKNVIYRRYGFECNGGYYCFDGKIDIESRVETMNIDLQETQNIIY
jgi:hypothetical protein